MRKAISALALLLVFGCLSAPSALAQDASNKVRHEANAQVTKAERIGRTPPLRDLIALPTPSAEKRAANKERKREVPNFFGRGYHPENNPDAQPQNGDKLRQTEFGTAFRNAQDVVEPLVNVSGILNGGGSPPDPTGDIGREFYLQAVNATSVRVYDKEGNTVGSTFSAQTLWNSLGFSSAGDPIILYDQEAGRWLLTEFAPPGADQLLVAISDDDNPLEEWTVYAFATPNFPDYPKYSIWPNAIVVTTNEGTGLPTYFIDRQAMLDGAASVDVQRIQVPKPSNSPGFFVGTPVDWTGDNPPRSDAKPMMMHLVDDAWAGGSDRIRVYEYDIDWQNPNNSSYTSEFVSVSPYDSNPCAASGFGFSCIPEPDGSGIDGLQEIIMNQVHYRNFTSHESIVLNFITDATGNGGNIAGIRWVELRRTPSQDDWSVHQEGTYAPDDGNHRFMAGIAMNGRGDIGLAFSVAGEDKFASLAFTGRRADDPLGTMTVDEYELIAGSSSNGIDRFGDYAQMGVDPEDDRTFWFTGEYMRNGGQWGTQVAAFQFTRDSIDFTPRALITPTDGPVDLDSPEETVSVEVQNVGLTLQFDFSVGYIFEDNPPVIQPFGNFLNAGESAVFTFDETVTMDELGEYRFKVFTSGPEDENTLNDTALFVVRRLPRHDAGVVGVQGFNEINCGGSIETKVIVENFAGQPLESVQVEAVVNGGPAQTVNWTGNLPTDETTEVEMTLVGLIAGMNTVTYSTKFPNGLTDEDPENDSLTRTFNVQLNGVGATLNLTTDSYPEETTWSLTDESGSVVTSGGPFPEQVNELIVENFCLSPGECYTFTIFDSFGDGITTFFGSTGDYQLVGADGELLAELNNPSFGNSETSDFCLSGNCTLEATASVTSTSDTNSSDGTILVLAENALGSVAYSINGGITTQTSPVFDGLPAGTYTILVADGNGCTTETVATIGACALDAVVTVDTQSAANETDGVITIIPTNGSAPYVFTVTDGTNTFEQTDPTFSNLMGVGYDVIVTDAQGCTTTINNVSVSYPVSVDAISSVGQTIEVMPNPTDGVVRLNVRGLQQESVFLKLKIFDAAGQLLDVSQLVRYDETFTGQISLVRFPAGIYYIAVMSDEMNKMVRIIKQ